MKGLGFLGAGNMGEAMIFGVLSAGLLPPSRIFVVDPSPGRAEELREKHGVVPCATAEEMLAACDTVVLAVKPQVLPSLLGSLPPGAAQGRLLLSVAAGVRLSAILSRVGEGASVARAMPNAPASVGAASTGIFFSPAVTAEERGRALSVFESFGTVAELQKEEQLDAVTALSGSGPAYAFLFVEALADGGVRAGLPRDTALRLAAATLEGAGRMVRETGLHPGALKDMVMSPSGTTAAGVAALEEGAFRGTILAAVQAAFDRCRELSRGEG
jgi:pyrroline-5-carboxylate reductase